MKIRDLFVDDSEHTIAIEKIHKLMTGLPYVKSYNLIMEFEDVDDKFKYAYTDLSLKVWLMFALRKIKRDIGMLYINLKFKLGIK